MDNTPTITDYTDVAKYLETHGIDFQVSSIKEEPNPADSLISFKYTVTLKKQGKKMRVSLYSTHGQYIRHTSKSCWEIIHGIFYYVRLAHVNSYKNFCIQAGFERVEDSKRFYNKCKRHWNRLVDIGLTCIDIAEIVNHSYNAQLKG